jgi:hypothetical protein
MTYGQIKSLMEYISLIVRLYEREVATITSPGSSPKEKEVLPQMANLKVLGTH